MILKAIALLKNNGEDITIVFTGKEYDYRSPDYFPSLKRFISEHNIESSVKLLGFIDRQDQLALIKHSVAVVQPSFYEGWSTVIEDAKSLSKKVIASNLSVHKEQLTFKGDYFNPKDEQELAIILKKVYNLPVEEIDYNYKEQIVKYASNFISTMYSY